MSPFKQRGLEGSNRSLFTILLFSLPILFFVYHRPLSSPFNTLCGSGKTDLWGTVWGFFWFKEVFLSSFPPLIHSDIINFPRGTPFFMTDPCKGLISLPFQALFGLPFTYNILIFISHLFTILSASLLLLSLETPLLPSLFGGLLYGLNPLFAGFANEGISEGVNGWSIPLFLLFLLKFMREKGRSSALLSGIFLSIAFYSSFYYGLSSLLFMILLLPIFAPGTGWGGVKGLFILILSSLLITIPLLFISFSTFDPEPLPLPVLKSMSSDPGGFLESPSRIWRVINDPSILKRREFYSFAKTNFLGFVPLFVLVAGSISLIRRRSIQAALPFLLLPVIFFTLSLGPYWSREREPSSPYEIARKIALSRSPEDGDPSSGKGGARGWRIPLPFSLFVMAGGAVTPRFPYRFHAPFILSILLLIPPLAERGAKGGRLRGSPLFLILSFPLLLEYLFLSEIPIPLPSVNARCPAYTSVVKGATGCTAILDIPGYTPDRPGSPEPQIRRHRYLAYNQTCHKKKAVADFHRLRKGGGTGNELMDLPLMRFLKGLDPLHAVEDGDFPEDIDLFRRDLLELKGAGVCCIALHVREMDEPSLDRIERIMEMLDVNGERYEETILYMLNQQ